MHLSGLHDVAVPSADKSHEDAPWAKLPQGRLGVTFAVAQPMAPYVFATDWSGF